MMHADLSNTGRVAVLLGGAFLASAALGDSYDFEVGLNYGNSSTDTVAPLAFSGGDTFGQGRSKDDADSFSVGGTWFYSGLADDEGPRSRAAFLSRASGVSLDYSYTDSSSRFSTTGATVPGLPPIAPSSGRGSSETDSIGASMRHVWKDSGWYALAGISHLDSDVKSEFNGGSFSFGFDATSYSLGGGYYFGKATALDLVVSHTDGDGEDVTAYALALTHIRPMGSTWQYALDVGIGTSDARGDDGSYSLGVGFFPSNDVEFGIELSQQRSSPGDSDSYGAYLSWYPSSAVELRASYSEVDLDNRFLSRFDSKLFSAGVNVRF